MSGAGGVVGMDVTHLHGAGQTISGRAGHGGAAARRVHADLETAHGHLAHPDLARAMRGFVTAYVARDAELLGPDLTAAGHHVSGVAATGRTSDDEAGHAVHQAVSFTEGSASVLDRSINLPSVHGSTGGA